MSFSNILKEDTVGLASVFKIKCHVCGAINHLETSPTHRSGKRGKPTFNINSQAALGCLHTGIGNAHLNNLLSTMNIPTMNHSTFKAREREVGKTVENVAQISCKENMNMEMNDAVVDGAEPDDNGLIGIPVSYDMGWQKRGRDMIHLQDKGWLWDLKLERCWLMPQDANTAEYAKLKKSTKTRLQKEPYRFIKSNGT